MQSCMGNQTRGPWKHVKQGARHLLNRERILWHVKWQSEPANCTAHTDSDWGGNIKDRKSTSGGVWFMGEHRIKTWSASQGVYALSSAEAYLYAMVERVTRAKGLKNLAIELGFSGISNVIHLGFDSSAAKSFVCRRGL
eukprot:8439293-Karenia_brevis.AAC.1